MWMPTQETEPRGETVMDNREANDQRCEAAQEDNPDTAQEMGTTTTMSLCHSSPSDNCSLSFMDKVAFTF